MSQVIGQTFQIGPAAAAAGATVALGTFVIPKGAKAVLTGLTVTGPATTTAAITTTLIASGGSTDTFAYHLVPQGAGDGTYTVSNGGKPISAVIDAASGAITLTGSSAGHANDIHNAVITGEFIS